MPKAISPTHGFARRRQPGQVLVLFALASIPIMGFVGLSVDGGNILMQRRIVQNGADAGTLAGVRDMIASLPGGGGPLSGDPIVTARKYATENSQSGNQLALTVTPEYINNAGAPVDRSAAAGLRVTVEKRFPTYFIGVLGIRDFTVRAVAAGKVQRFAGGAGPFLVCGDGLLNGPNLDDNSPTPADFFPGGILNYSTNPPTIRTEALGQDFFVHGPRSGQNDGDCDWETSSSTNFKGVSDEAFAGCTAPCSYPYSTGNRSGPIETHVAGLPGCSGTSQEFVDGCVVILPVVARKGSTGDTCSPPTPTGSMCVRAWVPFQVRRVTGPACGSPGSCHAGRIVQTVLSITGPGVDCTPPCTGTLVVKLTQ